MHSPKISYHNVVTLLCRPQVAKTAGKEPEGKEELLCTIFIVLGSHTQPFDREIHI